MEEKTPVTTGNRPRVIIVGMDGATFDVAGKLLAAGRLPALESVMRNGCRAVLESTTPWQSATAWTSCVTGAKPGTHGIYNFFLLRPDFLKKST